MEQLLQHQLWGRNNRAIGTSELINHLLCKAKSAFNRALNPARTRSPKAAAATAEMILTTWMADNKSDM